MDDFKIEVGDGKGFVFGDKDFTVEWFTIPVEKKDILKTITYHYSDAEYTYMRKVNADGELVEETRWNNKFLKG